MPQFSALLRHMGTDLQGLPYAKRLTATLSDGSLVVMVPDNNDTGAGMGGDSTGVEKIYLYHSADRVTFTLKSTISISKFEATITMSMCVDSANNIHYCYRTSAGAIQYRRMAYNPVGPAWTQDRNESAIAAPPAGTTFRTVDLDALGTSTDAVVIVAMRNQTSGTRSVNLASAVRTTGGSWVQQANHSLITGDSTDTYANDVSVASDNTNATTSVSYVWTAVRKGAITKRDFGDVIKRQVCNLTTGALSSQVVQDSGLNAGKGSGNRKYWAYCSGSGEFAVIGIVQNTNAQMFAYRFQSTGQAINRGATSPGNGNFVWVERSTWVTTNFDKTNKVFSIFSVNNAYSYQTGGKFLTGGVTQWFDNILRWYNSFTYNGVPIQAVYGGAQSRNSDPQRADTLLYAGNISAVSGAMATVKFAYRMFYRGKSIAEVPGEGAPGDGGTVDTDRPVVSAALKLADYHPQYLYKMRFQIASDASFATNLKDFYQPDTEFIAPSGTDPATGLTVLMDQAVSAINELTQGTWYIRARAVDTWGTEGAWSDAYPFVVSHLPVAANMYPRGNQVFAYQEFDIDEGTVTFTWAFSDPSPYDSQTAYQIVIEDSEANTVLSDTGKVAKVAPRNQTQTVSLNVPNTAVEKVLRWKITLWDTDDLAGPESEYQTFVVSERPEPAFTSILDGGTVNTGTPVIVWDHGASGTKNQIAYRFSITQGDVIRYDTNWVSSSETSIQLPVGIIRNANNYTFTIRVRDDYALEGTQTISINTAWTPPTTPVGLNAYLSEYGKGGFVWASIDNDEVDEFFTSYNLYRRRYGEAAWTMIHQWTSLEGEYFAFRDYFAESGQTYEYAVTQVTNSFGDVLESPIDNDLVVTVTPQSDRYWLIRNEIVDDQSIPLYNVTSDSFTDEYEQESYHVLGRGRHVDHGDRLGYSGNLQCQLRDQVTTGRPATNYAINAALSYFEGADQVPLNWELFSTTGETSVSHTPTLEPIPTGRLSALEVAFQDVTLATTAEVRIEQTIEGNALPVISPTGKATLSAWVFGAVPVTNFQWRLSMDLLDDLDVAQQSAAVTNPTPVEFYTSNGAGSPDFGNPYALTGQWQRIKLEIPWDADAAKLQIRIGIRGTTAGAAVAGSFYVTGIQVDAGDMTNYFDGSQRGGTWRGTPYESASFTSGFYTARQQRQDIEALKNLRQTIKLRNPFGDVWDVVMNDISVDRIPGVGSTEFTDVEIPYMEVSE